MDFWTFIKVILLGIVEGITEWLPISSTGHMILLDQFLKLDVRPSFKEMFLVWVQLAAILAVILIYFKTLFPWDAQKGFRVKKDTFQLWGKILLASIPAAIIGLKFDDAINDLFFGYQTVAITLILYGILFIWIETLQKNKKAHIQSVHDITIKTALFIGLFQILALIPGTSRSGVTIIGAMLLGASRTASAEFTFFLAIPVMLGAGLLKLVKFGFAFQPSEIWILAVGMITAFVVSILSIKFLIHYIKKHDFKAFGIYRIGLGLLVLIYFAFLG